MDPSPSKKKTKEEVKLDKKLVTMKYQYQGQTLASKMEDEVQWVIDTKAGHIELKDIEAQLQAESLEAPYRRIKRLSLVEETIFP